MFEQLPIGVTSLDHLIDSMANEAHDANRRDFAALREFMNRSISQRRRYLLEYITDLQRIYRCLPADQTK